MEDTKLSAEEIEQVVAQLENEKYNKATLDLVREDLEFGLTKRQIEMYKSKKLRYEQRREMSNAMRNGVPDDVVAKFSSGKYTEQQLSIFTEEFVEGFKLEKLLEIMDGTQSGYDMKEACARVKDTLSNTKEKPKEPEPKPEPETPAEELKDTKEPVVEKQVIIQPAVGTKEFLDSMQKMVDVFSDTMQKQFERMDKRDEELRREHDNEAERSLNNRITQLEKELSDSKKDLSAASGVVSDKEQIIRSMQSDMDNKSKELSIKEEEIKKLREEMEQMKTGNVSAVISDNTHSASDNNSVVSGGTSPTGHTVSEDGAGIPKVSPNHTGNYTMNLTMANGKQIPIQVERTERKSPFGISALMSKFLPKGPAKTLLTRMIEGRYSGEQLAEIVYAYDNKLNEAEVKELLDANLPAEEMHGIINVVAAAKGGEE